MGDVCYVRLGLVGLCYVGVGYVILSYLLYVALRMVRNGLLGLKADLKLLMFSTNPFPKAARI